MNEILPVPTIDDHLTRGLVDLLTGRLGSRVQPAGRVGRLHNLVDRTRLIVWLAERNRARDIRCVAVVPNPAIHDDEIARLEGAVAVRVVRISRVRPARNDRAKGWLTAARAH